MRVLVTGAGGLVGAALTAHCTALGDDVLAHARQTLDITDLDLVNQTIAEAAPNAVINCAAWTDVDGCESDQERAFLVNAQGPRNLADASRKAGAAFITISTDYVFDGSKVGFYTQRDEPNPLSVYGASKLEGERMAQDAYAQTIVVRTGFVFGNGGRNFLSTILARAAKGEKMQAIDDARGTPTYARDLASRLRELALIRTPEVFHVVNSGSGASYLDFARLALQAVGLEEDYVAPVSMSSLKRPAPRPANSCLRCLVSESMGLASMPDWKEALRAFVRDESRAESAAPVRS